MHVVDRGGDKQHIDVFQIEMLLGEDGISGLEKPLSPHGQDVAAIVSYRIDEIRLTCQDREFLVTVNGVGGLDPDPLDLERMSRLGHYYSLPRNVQVQRRAQACLGQNESAPVFLRQDAQRRSIEMVPMVVGDKSHIEFRSQFFGQYGGSFDLF